MKYKMIGAILCVMVMVGCPLATLSVNDSVAADDIKNSATITVDELSNDDVKDLFGEEGYKSIAKDIAGVTFKTIRLNKEIIDYSDITSTTIKEFNYSSGYGNKFDGDKSKQTISSFYSIDCNVNLGFTITSDKEINVLMSYPQIISSNVVTGDGVNQLLKKFGNDKLKSNDKVAIEGKVTIEGYYEEVNKDIFHVEDKYYPTKIDSSLCGKIKFDLEVTVKDYKFHDEFSIRCNYKSVKTYEIINGEKKDYKEGSLQSYRFKEYFELYESSGTKKIDGNNYNYTSVPYPTEEYGPTIGDGPFALSYGDEIKYSELMYFDESLDDKTIVEKVNKNGGSSNKDYSGFEDKANKVRSDFKIEENNYFTIFLIIAAVIVIAMALLFFYDRKKSGN